MRESDYPKVRRRGVVVMAILLLLLLFGAFAPVAMAQTWPNCGWYQNCTFKCVAQDVRITDVWLGYCNNGTPIGSCTAGTPVQACIWANYESGPSRYQFYTFFDLYIDGVYQYSNCTCNDTEQVGWEMLHGPLQWICGQRLDLKDVLITWSVDSDCNCSDPACCWNGTCACDHLKPKCWGPKNIIVKAPLVANFTHTAPQCYCTDINFYGTATGGSPAYSYSWDFGDGNSSTGQNTNHH